MHYFSFPRRLVQTSVFLFVALNNGVGKSDASKIQVGADPPPGVGWIEGVCYAPIIDAQVGDELEFILTGHDVYKMPSKLEYETCDFNTATLLAEAGSGKYTYTITEEDARNGDAFFACGIGSHCMGLQKLRVVVATDVNDLIKSLIPTSTYVLGLSSKDCLKLQYNTDVFSDGSDAESFEVDSDCTDPIMQDDGGFRVSCISPPATLNPGGVIWEARILHYPFPKDRRVRNGLRIWEFVKGDPGKDGFSGLTPVPQNQLYVHHLSGTIVFGQGTEGQNNTETDTEFSEPYGMITGDEGDLMIFHIIDLRDVDDWLSCVECRCKDANGNYLGSGGVNCCTNCTSTTLEPSTIDYRMRYNVTYYEIEEYKPVDRVIWLSADQSPSVGKNIEYDVPQFESLSQDQKVVNSDNPDQKIQRLERVGPFNTIFHHGYFKDKYHGPETVKILRCVAHFHVAGIGMWLEDTVTGQTICSQLGRYGTDPESNEGLLVGIDVNDYVEPIEIPADRVVRLVTEYDASEYHFGVMAMIFLFVLSGEEITRDSAALTVDMCILETCDASMLPSLDDIKPKDPKEACINELFDHPMCKFGNLCDCETVVNAPESSGCNGVYISSFGDLEINSVCNKYCGCPSLKDDNNGQVITVSKTTCQDSLIEFPVCKFGGVCDCKKFVNMPESTGCGGVFTSEWGEVEVNEVCESYCGSCTDYYSTNEESVDTTDAIIEMIENGLDEACQFATNDCKFLLSNLYTCAEVVSYVETHPVMIVVRDHGKQLALEYSKLGESNLHVVEDDQKVVACGGNFDEEDVSNTNENTKVTESMRDCDNRLSKSPACRFGKLCDCEDFVNHENSGGCGGVFTSRFGDTSVNEMCASYCGACLEIEASARSVTGSVWVVVTFVLISSFIFC
jgi:hypothetical protein